MTDPGRFSISVRVYYEDTDAGGIVYHANYLRFMERARTDWLRSLGASHRAMAQQDGLQFVVSEIGLLYLKPARLDDLLTVELSVLEVRRASFRLVQQVTREADGERLAEATIRVALTDRSSGRPAAMPRWLMDVLGNR